MAIINNSIKKYTQDENKNIKIGIDYPVNLNTSGSDGYFQATTTTIQAVKTNIINLLNTHQGERLMQPRLGLNIYLNNIPQNWGIELKMKFLIYSNFGYHLLKFKDWK